ncbi:Type 1 glutamine amidotransferase-like domain-containing protein [Schleiferia thermophila]|uniref:Type 1 glutamine amidotransferase-like domain-containing protein n=1 Tax=Schleiferia thermophila TaxID=884107 RepID=UPI000F62442E|nr:Type 1 glutamine amidotransferase-like domain-containing protein [Schleiferia thermophila]GCD80013.1 hypothetical protein JCM30197_12600 [Schleiferia thermophila]
MKKLLIPFAIATTTFQISGQSYDLYHIGSMNDTVVTPERGIVLMGGGGENDQAMRWFLQRANGGDVVVLRTSGGAGYQNYLYHQLNVPIHSVRTLVLKSRQHSFDSVVVDILSKAEAIWIAGGNQATYVNFWKNTPVDSLINHLYHSKGGVVGGISAGMAVLTGYYYSALNASAESNVVLMNPFHASITLGANDFIQLPHLQRVIGDTHLNNPDRRGRLTVFMARLLADHGHPVLGIGVNEYSAVCINDSGIARVFGEYPKYPDDRATFVSLGCVPPFEPENLQQNTPLTWNRSNAALFAFVAPADTLGSVTLDLNDWKTSTGGGFWENWYVINGSFSSVPASHTPTCSAYSGLGFPDEGSHLRGGVSPNPAVDKLTIQISHPGDYTITDVTGRIIRVGHWSPGEFISVSELHSGLYMIQIHGYTFKFNKI